MKHMPAVCTGCGAVFPCDLFEFKPAARVGIKNAFTRCPHCHAAAAIADGVYEMANGTLKLLQGPKATREAVERLQAAAAIMVRTKTVDPAFGELLTAVNPALGPLYRKFAGTGTGRAILFASCIYVACQAADGLIGTINNGWDLIDRLNGTRPEAVVTRNQHAEQQAGGSKPGATCDSPEQK